MTEKQIKKEIEEYINDIEENKFMCIISSDILAYLGRRLVSYLYGNIERFGLSKYKLDKKASDIWVNFNREKQKLELKLNIKGLR